MTEESQLPPYFAFGTPPAFPSIVEFGRCCRMAEQARDANSALEAARALIYGVEDAVDVDESLAKEFLALALELGNPQASLYLGLLEAYDQADNPVTDQDALIEGIAHLIRAFTNDVPQAGYHLYELSLHPHIRPLIAYTNDDLDAAFAASIIAKYPPALFFIALKYLAQAEAANYPPAIEFLRQSDTFDPPPPPPPKTNVLAFQPPTGAH